MSRLGDIAERISTKKASGMSFEDYWQWMVDLKVGDEVMLYWTAGSFGHFKGMAKLVRVNAKSVAGALLEEVMDRDSSSRVAYPKGHVIVVPRDMTDRRHRAFFNAPMPVGVDRILPEGRTAAAKAPKGALILELAAVPNHDYHEGAWEAQVNIRPTWRTVHSLREAVQEAMRFSGRNSLGGGNWTGGRVVDDEGKDVARISYNGRVWEPGEYPTPEIDVRKFDKERYERLEAWRAGLRKTAGNVGSFEVDMERYPDGSMETRLLIHGQVHLSAEWPDASVYEACLSAVERILQRVAKTGRKP